MQRRFTAWAVLALAMLGGSTVFGWLLTASIGPRKPDYNRVWGAPARAAAVAVQNIVVVRQFTAFLPPQPPVGFQAQEFKRTLDAISGHLADRQFGMLVSEFWADRMAGEEIPLGFYELLGQAPTQALVAESSRDIAEDLALLAEQRPEIFPAGTAEVLRILWSQDGQEVIVIAKHTGQPTGTRFARWWMRRDNFGMWKVYDFDFPDTRLRFLTVRNYLLNAPVRDHAALGLGRAPDPNALDVTAYYGFQDAFSWLMLAGSPTDPAALAAGQYFDRKDSIVLLPYVRSARQAGRVRLAAVRGNAAQAEAALNDMPQVMATAGFAKIARAINLNAKKNPKEARAAIRDYRHNVGDDPIAYLEDAKAVAALDGPNAAIVELRKGLSIFPGNVPIAMELARRIPADEREAFGEELATTANAEVLNVAATLFEKQFPSILDALVTGYLRAKPNHPAALSIAVQAKLALGQTKSAGDLLKRIPADQRRSIVDLFIGRALFAPSPVDHYAVVATAGEGRRAFRGIVPAFANTLLVPAQPPDHMKRLENLKALLAAHRAAESADPWLHYGDAVAFAATGDAVKADAELASGMAKLTPPKRTERLSLALIGQLYSEDWEQFRRLRTELLAKRGKWKQAYDELLPAVDTFDHLAARFAMERDEFAIAELIELHAKKFPGDLELIAWRGEVSFLKKDYENAVKLFQDYRDKSGKENRQYFRMAERLIRSHVRLKQPDEAREALDEANDAFPIPALFRVLVAAAAGDADAVMEQFDRNAAPFNPIVWYSDPDLGPLLRTPEFESVRQKYPPPVR